MTPHDSVTSHMLRFRKIDLLALTVRDVLILWAVIKLPGAMGFDVARAIGFSNRSSVQSNIDRLLTAEFIEDRRVKKDRMHPNRLYATDKGRAFFDDITS